MLQKLVPLESLLLGIEPDFVALTETWLTNEIKDFEVTPPNYVIIRKDRQTRGGGVAILLKKELSFEILPEVIGVEAIFCKLLFTSRPVFVGCVYRSPSSDKDSLQALHTYMHRYVLGARLILLGDFNLPDINWRTMQHNSACTDALIDIMLTFNLSQIVKQPTRIQGCCSNILDLVFLSDHFPADNAQVEILEGISDHEVIQGSVSIVDIPIPSNSFSAYLDFNHADDTSILDHLFHELASFELLANDSNTNVEILWASFKSVVTHCVLNYVPSKTKKTRKHNPWITREIIHCKRKVKRLRKTLKAKPTPQIRNKLSQAITKMKSQIKMSKANYFTSTLPNFLKTSPQKFWNYLNPKNRIRPAAPEESKDKANSLNNYFQSVFTIDDGNVPDVDICNTRHIEPLVVTESGVLNLLLKLDTKKGAGPDNLPNEFLRRYAEWVAKYLCILFNKSLSTCSLPQEWKIAKVAAVHKSGSEADPSNFRPISLTSTTCKLLEHIILKHLTLYLDQNHILSPLQHGFRKGLSTVTQLVELIHDISLNVDCTKQTDLILLDFSKAFDRVPHKKLIKKLEATIGAGPLTDWIDNYLSNRTQYVQVNRESSTIANVTSGVPQGSVLAPILFLIFINDLPAGIGVNVRLFADDCILYQEINAPEDHVKLNNALQFISKWCALWQMTLNVKKSALLRITRKKQVSEFVYVINNSPLPVVTEHKYLGLTLTQDFRWDIHVSHVTSAALKRLFFLRRSLASAPPETKLLAYKAFVRPVLEYANVAWFPFTNNLINALERIQRKAIRFVYNKYRITDSPTELLKKAGLLTIKNRAKLARQKFLYQLVHQQLNIDSSKYMSFKETRPTRQKHSQTLNEYQCRTDCLKYSFFPLAIREWNNLPISITNSQSLETFSSLLECYLLSSELTNSVFFLSTV